MTKNEDAGRAPDRGRDAQRTAKGRDVQATSRMDRRDRLGTHRPRVVRRSNSAKVAGYRRHHKPVAIEALLGQVVKRRELTDQMREQCISIAWREMVGEKLAKHSSPGKLVQGTLTVWTAHSVWTQELSYSKTEMITKINAWLDARQLWLGGGSCVSGLRFVLGMPREAIVDADQLRDLRRRYRRRLRPEQVIPAPASGLERDAILAETSTIEDSGVRQEIERLRMYWNL